LCVFMSAACGRGGFRVKIQGLGFVCGSSAEGHTLSLSAFCFFFPSDGTRLGWLYSR
jgi:hypothetical protein